MGAIDDRHALVGAIEHAVDLGLAFMVEHTDSKTPMREAFWTLWHAPITPEMPKATVSKILKEAARCHRHNPCAYVRIIATVPENATQKVTYIIHKPAEKPVQRR